MKPGKNECLDAILSMARDGKTVWPASLVSALGISIREVKDLLTSLKKRNLVLEDSVGVLVLTEEGFNKADRFHKKKKLIENIRESKAS